jgi:hypothetical protein
MLAAVIDCQEEGTQMDSVFPLRVSPSSLVLSILVCKPVGGLAIELCMVETLLVRNSAGKVEYLCSQLAQMMSLRNLAVLGMLIEWSWKWRSGLCVCGILSSDSGVCVC